MEATTATARRELARRIALTQLARHGNARQVVRLTAANPVTVIRVGR